MSEDSIKSRATTDEAKQQIIERLHTLWRQHPHLRLGQLILNIDRDPFYREDEDLMNALEQGYANVYHPSLIRQLAQQAINDECEEGGFAVENAPYAEHYKGHSFEPVDIAEAYQLNFNEGNVVKYLLRWRKKDGIKDLQKARYYIERLISLEERRLQEAGKSLSERGLAQKILSWIERTEQENMQEDISYESVVSRLSVLANDIEALCKEHISEAGE